MRLAGVPRQQGNSNLIVTKLYDSADFGLGVEIAGLAVSKDGDDMIRPFDPAIGFYGFISSVDLQDRQLNVCLLGLGVPVQFEGEITGDFGINASGKLCSADSAVILLDGVIGSKVACLKVTGPDNFEAIELEKFSMTARTKPAASQPASKAKQEAR